MRTEGQQHHFICHLLLQVAEQVPEKVCDNGGYGGAVSGNSGEQDFVGSGGNTFGNNEEGDDAEGGNGDGSAGGNGF